MSVDDDLNEPSSIAAVAIAILRAASASPPHRRTFLRRQKEPHADAQRRFRGVPAAGAPRAAEGVKGAGRRRALVMPREGVFSCALLWRCE